MSKVPRPSNHSTDVPASKRHRSNACPTALLLDGLPSALLLDELRRPFARLRGRIPLGPVSKNTWNDNELRKLDYLDLYEFNRFNREMQLQILERALSCLTHQVTAIDVGYLLSCAWSLRSCENPDDIVFKDDNMLLIPTPIQSPSDNVRYTSRFGEPVVAPRKLALQDAWIKSGCYMCAASLRLITKDHNNLGKAWKSIEKQFSSYYGHRIALCNVQDNRLAYTRLLGWSLRIMRCLIKLQKESLINVLLLLAAVMSNDDETDRASWAAALYS